MIQIRNCSKSFGAESLFHQLNLNINPGDKIGLIGPNGCGKTTLMQLIYGMQQPDEGRILLAQTDVRMAYLPQQVYAPAETTVAAYLDLPFAHLSDAYRELEILSANIMERADEYQTLLESIQQQEMLLALLKPIQQALGLAEISLDQAVQHLSSGQKTRLGMAKIALYPADVILLDEPTNHLDQTGRSWLLDWVRNHPAAILIVSHDRDFIDQVVQKIWVMDKARDFFAEFEGSYSAFRQFEAQQREKQAKEYEMQREEIQDLQHAVRVARAQAVKKKGGKGDSGDKFAKGFFNDRTRHMVKKAKTLEKRVHELEENLSPPTDKDWLLSMRFQSAERSSERILEAHDLVLGYGDTIVLRAPHLAIRYGERIVLSGENGCGKTTLLQTLAGNLPPISGTIQAGHQIQRGTLTQEQTDMPKQINAVQYLQSLRPADETSVRNFLARYLFTQDKVYQPIHSLSNGEKKRLALAGLVFSGCNVLFLDEPLNHLDIPSREQIQAALQQFKGTILVVEHDLHFIRTFPTLHWTVKSGNLLTEPAGSSFPLFT